MNKGFLLECLNTPVNGLPKLKVEIQSLRNKYRYRSQVCASAITSRLTLT